MPPSALRLMIVQLAVHSTFRARPTRQLLVGQMDVDLSVGQLQLNRLDVPRRLDPENALIKVSILHSQNCLTPFSATAQNPLQSRNSQRKWVDSSRENGENSTNRPSGPYQNPGGS